MRFKDLFDRDILGEATVRKNLKIFYRIDLNLVKNAENTPDNNQQQPANNTQQPIDSTTAPEQTPEAAPVDNTSQAPADTTAAPAPEPTPAPEDNTAQQETPQEEPKTYGNTIVKFSVMTEDEIAADDKKVMRKFSDFDNGIEISEKEQDTINSFQDILDKLADTKKDGTPILDDYCVNIIGLLANKKYDQIKNDLSKKSKIFVEICYGYNKSDSVGIRFNKSENSETITSLMLVDNKIISMPFSIDRFNEKVIMLRNNKISNS